MTGGPALVHFGEHGGAADGHNAVVEILGETVAEIELRAIHFHGRQEMAVRQVRQTFGLAADTGEIFYIAVPGLDIGVADGPIYGVSFFQVGFEVEIAPAIALASPGNRFSADLASANPREF